MYLKYWVKEIYKLLQALEAHIGNKKNKHPSKKLVHYSCYLILQMNLLNSI